MKWIRILLPTCIILAIGLTVWYNKTNKKTAQQKVLTSQVKKSDFKVAVSASGELRAKKSEQILAPAIEMQGAGLFQTTISNLVPEGTIVKAGDYVAELDRNQLGTRIKDVQAELEKVTTQLEQAKIDTAIDLRNLRDQLINLEFTIEEKELLVSQSKFEPQSVYRQAMIDKEKTQRDFEQLKNKYKLTLEKSVAKIAEINAGLRQSQGKLQRLMDLSAKFRVSAPKSGMVIYARNWNGKKGPGSQVSAWDPEVAELPDLSQMISKSFVNEVDISKIRVGQDVKIAVDAFPGKNYTGQVLSIANVGEEMRNYDSKVFEVIIGIQERDSILKPAMSTTNDIKVYEFTDALTIPIEAVSFDSLSYVYAVQDGQIEKKEILLGPSNGIEIMVFAGLTENEEIRLTPLDEKESFRLTMLAPNAKKMAKEKYQNDLQAFEKALAMKAEEAKKQELDKEKTAGGGVIFVAN
jgi:multidrug efflux pump subunit AcrA (membrane-fusion protein)